MSPLSKIHFQEEDFIRKHSLQCSLFIQIAENSCRLLVLDQENKIRLLEEIEFASFLAKKWTFSNLKFAKTKILSLPESFIFIPNEFEEEDKNVFLPFLNKKGSVLQSKLADTSICTHYTIDKSAETAQSQIPGSQLLPSSNSVIKHLLSIATENTEFIGINFYKKEMELVYVKNKKFVFYNRFPKENADDFNFYLLSAFEQFNIKAAHTQFYLTGNIHEADENFTRLSKYSSHLHFMSDQNSIKYSTVLKDGSFHPFFLLSELSKCVL